MQKSEIESMVSKLSAALPAVTRIEKIDARLAGIRGEQKSLRGLLPKNDAAHAIAAWLRGRRERFERGGGDHLSARDAIYQVSSRPRHLRGLRGVPEIRDQAHAFDFLVWLLGDRVDAMVHEAVGRLEYVEGASAVECERKGEALESEREALLAEREGLVAEAQAAGIEVQHLDETRQRLEARAEREKDQAEARRRQEEAAKAIDTRHDRERASRSLYLAAAQQLPPVERDPS
jgi:hypothetical protein